jgi:hypothetical protein
MTFTVSNTPATFGPELAGTFGIDGTSPFDLSLDEDFISVATDSKGNIATDAFPEGGFPLVLTAYEGSTSIKIDGKIITLECESNGISIAPDSTDNTKYYFTAIGEDRGNAIFTLKRNGTPVATANFEAVK